MKKLIATIAIPVAALLLALPALAADAGAPAKTSREAIARMIDSGGKAPAIADERTWIENDPMLMGYRRGRKHEELMKTDAHYRDLVASELKDRRETAAQLTAMSMQKQRILKDFDAMNRTVQQKRREIRRDVANKMAAVDRMSNFLENIYQEEDVFDKFWSIKSFSCDGGHYGIHGPAAVAEMLHAWENLKRLGDYKARLIMRAKRKNRDTDSYRRKVDLAITHITYASGDIMECDMDEPYYSNMRKDMAAAVKRWTHALEVYDSRVTAKDPLLSKYGQ